MYYKINDHRLILRDFFKVSQANIWSLLEYQVSEYKEARTQMGGAAPSIQIWFFDVFILIETNYTAVYISPSSQSNLLFTLFGCFEEINARLKDNGKKNIPSERKSNFEVAV